MANLDQIATDILQTTTRIDLPAWMARFTAFSTAGVRQIQAWLNSGTTGLPVPNTQLSELKALYAEGKEFLADFGNAPGAVGFNNSSWALADALSDAVSRLRTWLQMPRFMRVSVRKATYAPGNTRPFQPSPGQSLQNVAGTVEFSTNPLNDWVNIALANELREEDYSISATPEIMVSASPSTSFPVQAVLDFGEGERLLGTDFDRNITYVGGNDLKVLAYRESFAQQCEVLATIKKGDLPQYPDIGLPPGARIGGNVAAFNIPVVIRSLQQTFGINDSVARMEVLDITQKGSVFRLTMNIVSIYQQNFLQTVAI